MLVLILTDVGSVTKLKFGATFTVKQIFNEVTVEQVRCIKIYNKAKKLEKQSLKPSDVTQKLKDLVYNSLIVSGIERTLEDDFKDRI